MTVIVDQIREFAGSLPRSYEAIVHGRLKIRIGQIVYLSLATDGSTMGCGFPKEFREAAIEAEPEKFSRPRESYMRFNWIHVNLDAIDYEEMRDLVENAWSNCVPKSVAGVRGGAGISLAAGRRPRSAGAATPETSGRH